MKDYGLYDAQRRLPASFLIHRSLHLKKTAFESFNYSLFPLQVESGRRSFRFRMVEKNGRMADFKPGQYAALSLYPHKTVSEERPFTIVSAPCEGSSLEFCIKDWDDWTAALKMLLLEETSLKKLRVRVRGPYGNFSYQNAPGSGRFIFIAAGMGINPFISMLRSMAMENSRDKVLLLWGARNHEELWALNELSELASRIQGFRFYPLMSHDPLWKGEKGRITNELLDRIIPAFFGQNPESFEWNSASYWVCGPGGFRVDLKSMLKNKGIKSHALHEEIFIV